MFLRGSSIVSQNLQFDILVFELVHTKGHNCVSPTLGSLEIFFYHKKL